MKNEAKYKEANEIRIKYNVILNDLSIKSRNGDNKAALEIMRKMTEQRKEIRKTGFELGFDRNNIVTRQTYLRQSLSWRRENAEILKGLK